MAPRQSGLGDRGRAQVRSNFADIGRTPGKDNPDLYLRRPHVADMLDEFKSLVNGSGMSPDEAFLTLQEKYPLNAPDDFAALRTYINDIGAEGDPVGRPRTFTDARRAADPAIQSDAEAARIKNRVVRLRDTPEADLIPGQTADDAARLADRARTQHASTFGKPSSAPAESWTDRVMGQSGKPVPDAPPPMPRPAPASSPLAARARDLTSGAELVGPGELDDPLTMSNDGPTGTGGPRTPAREAQLAGRTYEGPGTPPPYRPEGTDPTKGGRAAADAARKARLNGSRTCRRSRLRAAGRKLGSLASFVVVPSRIPSIRFTSAVKCRARFALVPLVPTNSLVWAMTCRTSSVSGWSIPVSTPANFPLLNVPHSRSCRLGRSV